MTPRIGWRPPASTPTPTPTPENGAAPDAAPQALFVSKSVATRQVIAENEAFTQTVQLKNIGAGAWKGFKLVRLPNYGAANKATDALGAQSESIAVPDTPPGGTVTLQIPLKAVKSNPKSGAAQAAPWELRQSNGTKVPILTAPATPAKGGCVWTVITITPPAGANVPDLRHAAYTDPVSNLYVKIGNGGQCTAYVYARIKEKLGIDLRTVPGATFGSNSAGQKWIDQLTGPGKPYALSPLPVPHSAVIWSLVADPNNGHVAFVEGIDAAGKVLYTEANAISWQSFAADNGPESDTWGGGYDGKLRSNTPAEMQAHLGSKYVLRGYIGIA